MSLREEVGAILDAAGIRHALIGALALSAYGMNRASLDVDLFATDPACLRPGLWADLQSRGIAVEIRKGDLTDPLAGVVRCRAPGQPPVDLVVGKSAWQARVLERAEPIGATLVVRATDLVLLKLYAGGPQDAWDVQQLLARPFRDDLIREVESRLAAPRPGPWSSRPWRRSSWAVRRTPARWGRSRGRATRPGATTGPRPPAIERIVELCTRRPLRRVNIARPPAAYERANYVQILQSWSAPAGW